MRNSVTNAESGISNLEFQRSQLCNFATPQLRNSATPQLRNFRNLGRGYAVDADLGVGAFDADAEAGRWAVRFVL